MKKKLIFFSLAIFVFFACASDPDIFTPLDYSSADMVENEINNITVLSEKSSVQGLWRAYLLKTNCKDDPVLLEKATGIFENCVNKIVQEYNSALSAKDYTKAYKLHVSLDAVKVQNFSEYSQSQIYQFLKDSFPLVPTNSAAGKPVYSLINGTVTVWVDLGIQVENGMGYPNYVIGSGFFIRDSGYIVTNYHVIQTEVDPEYEGYSRLYIKLASDPDTRIPAKVVGWDPVLDLALLKTEIDAPLTFSLGSSEDLSVGDRIYAIGSPAGLDRTLTSGIVSSVDRSLFTIGSVMQIDAAVNSGNSGGPIVDSNGNVQGITFAGMLEYTGLNFAIPVEYLKVNLPYLLDGGLRKHGWISAFGDEISRDEFTSRPAGVEVQYVKPGGSAYRSGLKVKDVITSVNGIAVTNLNSFHEALMHFQYDTIVEISVWSEDGTTKNLPVYIEERPKAPGYELYKSDLVSNVFLPIFGMELTPVNSSKKLFAISNVVKGSVADESGFSVHDPLEIVKVHFSEDKKIIYSQVFSKKRKNGYLEVNIMIAASLDSPNYF